MSEQIEGRNPVLEALRAGHEFTKLYIAKDAGGNVKEIIAMARRKGIPIYPADETMLGRMAETRNHQGVIGVAAEWHYKTVADLLTVAEERNEPPLLLLLDGVEDPQNLGSIIRTAEASGVHGIIIPERRAVGLTATVCRASAGAVEHMGVARVTNLTRTMEDLKKDGLWFTGTDMESGTNYHQSDLRGPMGLVIGGEGKGVSRLVKEHCDQIVKIPMRGQISSLNASVATGVILFEIRRQRDLGGL